MNKQEHALNFIDKLLQPELRPRLQQYVEHRRTSGPLIVEFDPTTACNFECPECISAGLLNKGQFKSGRTIELMKEFYRAGVKGVIFIGGGEPLAHKGMPAPIIKAHDLGMSVGLTTNGSLIDRYLLEIAENVAWTRVSVDASSQEIFSIFRPSHIPNSFDKVIRNMEALAKLKKGILGFSFLLMERKLFNGETVSNCEEVFTAAKLAKEIGSDYFELKPIVDQNHHLISLSDKARKSLEEQLLKLLELGTDRFKVIAPKSVEHLLTSLSPDQPKTYTTCPTLELRTVVTPKGIYPCPYKRGHEDEKIGEAEVKFDEYWRSDERYKRTQLINPSEDCTFYCIRHQLNVLLHMLADAHDEGLNLLLYMIKTNLDDVFI